MMAMAVSRARLQIWPSPVRSTAGNAFYSMSAQIQKERRNYYAILETTQKGDLDITKWLLWFLACLSSAFANTEKTLAAVLHKAHFRDRFATTTLNDRQRQIVDQLLNGFEGKLTSSK